MTYATDCTETHPQDECRHYSWLEDYLERLEAKEARKELQERCKDMSEYYTLVASLMA